MERDEAPQSPRQAFYPGHAERLLRQQGLKQNVAAYLQGMADGTIDPGLHPYQEESLPRILNKIWEQIDTAEAAVADGAELNFPLLTHNQIADAATGFGKGFLIAKVLEACGIGKPAHSESIVPLSALVLSHRVLGVKKELAGALRKFIPRLDASILSSDNPNVSGHAALSTYALIDQLRKQWEEGRQTITEGRHFDLVMTDENHWRWGADYMQSVNHFAAGAVEVGLTATPRRTTDNQDVPVSFKYSLRTFIQTSKKAPAAQILGFATGKAIRAAAASKDPAIRSDESFSWMELKPLMTDGERNMQIVEILKLFAMQKRFSLTALIPGGRCRHPRIIAELARAKEHTIIDPITGDPRNLCLEPIDGYMPDRQIEDLLERAREPYEVSGLDGLLSTRYGLESWDNPNIGAALAASPLALWELLQFIGRTMRLGSHQVVILGQLIDAVVGNKKPALLSQALEEKDFFNGMVIGDSEQADAYNQLSGWQPHSAPQHRDRKGRSSNQQPKMLEHIIVKSLVENTLLKWSEAAASCQYEWTTPIIREKVEKLDMLEHPPEGSALLQGLYGMANVQEAEIGLHAFYGLLESNGFSYVLVRTAEGASNYVLEGAEAEAFLRDYTFTDFAPKGRLNVGELTVKFSTTRPIVESTIDALIQNKHDMSTEEYRSRNTGRKHDTYGPEQIALIDKGVKERKAREAPKTGKTAVAQLADEIDVHRNVLRTFLRSQGVNLEKLYSHITGLEGYYCLDEEAKTARFHFAHTKMPKTAQRLDILGEKYDMSEDAVVKEAAEIGMAGLLQKGYLRHITIGKEDGRTTRRSTFTYHTFFDRPRDAAKLDTHLRKLVDRQRHAGAAPPEPLLTAPEFKSGDPSADLPIELIDDVEVKVQQHKTVFSDPTSEPISSASMHDTPPVNTTPPASSQANRFSPEEQTAQPLTTIQRKAATATPRAPKPAPKPSKPYPKPNAPSAKEEATTQNAPPRSGLAIPANFRNISEGLAMLDAHCDPSLIGWLKVRSKAIARKGPDEQWYASDDTILALATTVQSYPLADPAPQMKTPADIAAGFKEYGIVVQDVYTITTHTLAYKPPIRATGEQLTHRRTRPTSSTPSMLTVFYRQPLVRHLEERLKYHINNGQLPLLVKWRILRVR